MKAMKANDGNEEEEREQGRARHLCQGDGAPRQQSKNRRWLDRQGPDQEQERQGCEQEEERPRQEVAVDPGLREGTQGTEDQGLRRDQEGHAPVRKSQGILRQLS